MSLNEKEILWLTYIHENETKSYITSDTYRNNYFLYDKDWKRIAKGKSPSDFEDKLKKLN